MDDFIPQREIVLFSYYEKCLDTTIAARISVKSVEVLKTLAIIIITLIIIVIIVQHSITQQLKQPNVGPYFLFPCGVVLKDFPLVSEYIIFDDCIEIQKTVKDPLLVKQNGCQRLM